VKYFQSHLTFMKNNQITVDLLSGYPTSQYPNSTHFGYHDFYEIEFFLEGEGLHYLNAVPYQIRSGYFYLLFPGDYHRMQIPADKHYHFYNLKFTLAASNPELMREIGKYPRPYSIYLAPDKIRLMEQEFSFLHSVLQNQTYSERLTCNIVDRICILLLEFLNNSTDAVQSSPVDRRIFQIIDYIEKNHTGEISLAELARTADLSENYLGIFFKKNTGKKLTEYINQRRILHAIQLLGNTNMSIKEVAYNTGFGSPEYMARIFKLHGFSTPKSYQIH